jgi:ribosome recycling factor
MDINIFREKAKAAIERLEEELKKVRTGRAHPDMLDSVRVEAYGVETPLKQVANVTAPEAQLLQIAPFDPSNIEKIVEAIRKNESLGLNPSDDGRVVRAMIPQLTEERRAQIAKQLGSNGEDCKISLRNLRHQYRDALKDQKKNGEIGDDELKRAEKELTEEMDRLNKQVDDLIKLKEEEIMKV